MAVLNIAWSTMGSITPRESQVVTPKEGDEKGQDDAAPAPVKRADKPIMVYVADPGAADAEAFDKVEKVVLTEDKIVIGLKAFTCVRVTPEQAAQDKLLAGVGKEVPRIIFVTVDYKDTTVIEGSKLSVSQLWDAMQKQYSKVYEGSLEKNCKAMIKLLQEFDKVNAARNVQEEKEKRADKPTAADKAEWTKTKEELDERQKKAEKERDALLKFEKKTKVAA
jgi:hypothetical protein